MVPLISNRDATPEFGMRNHIALVLAICRFTVVVVGGIRVDTEGLEHGRETFGLEVAIPVRVEGLLVPVPCFEFS